MKKILQCVTLLGFFLLSAPSLSHAATCTINGYMQYEPVERYYCHTAHQNCSGWLQQDLHAKRGSSAAPMRYMRVSFWDNAGNRLATTHTNGSGWFSVAVTLPACAGTNVRVQREFVRIHESDLTAAVPRYRFRVVDNTTARNIQSDPRTITLSGATTDGGFSQLASDTNARIRYSNVYHTVDSAISEIVGWNSTLNTRLSYSSANNAQAYVVSSTYTGASHCESNPGQTGTVFLNWGDYANGGLIRHELGHWVQAAFHNFGQSNFCLDYKYHTDAAGTHSFASCEFGYASNKEALAHFIATRSITSADTNAWFCQFNAGVAQEQCSVNVKLRDGDTDPLLFHANDGVNPFTMWFILGDSYANAANRCAVTWDSCQCGGSGTACNDQTFRNNNGFRNEIQPARLFWDLLDTNNEGNDDVDLSMGQLVTAFMGMASGTSNGQFNEPKTSDPCLPEQANVADYAARVDAYMTANGIAGSTASERTLNCVSASVP